MYREIVYTVGKVSQERAERKLGSIPDPDLRLIAQIELSAALCGVPALKTLTQRTSNRKAT
ncbi:MAG: hypothetical protein JO108_21260 [Acidobacteriaceae bacterium]|nr:hypothetical protein [Acidobacteriaceae bacterium]